MTIFKRLRQGIDVFKLGIALWMLASLSGLDYSLQAIVQIITQIGYFAISNPMALPVQFFGLLAGALAGPTQRRLRVPAIQSTCSSYLCATP